MRYFIYRWPEMRSRSVCTSKLVFSSKMAYACYYRPCPTCRFNRCATNPTIPFPSATSSDFVIYHILLGVSLRQLDDICDERCLRYRLDHRALVLFSEMVLILLKEVFLIKRPRYAGLTFIVHQSSAIHPPSFPFFFTMKHVS